ncbi:splicing factor 3b [Fusarium langsethiae]|uniref:Splicing factor 3b n=1 Tax=Fusarium langsethiae TaxID=179993 RepID=A0A0N0DBS8_FUSLA|nr:splicing factor 3b [Fusarium langsethiae]
MATYTATAQQGGDDLRMLFEQRYNLQVAKSVAGPDGSPHFNVVYQSRSLAPTMSVSWTLEYGLNWTADPPNSGARVRYWGYWQPCDLGASYDLDEAGWWVPNQNNPNTQPNALNVGRNGYQTPVHIIVGVQDANGSWQPIWTVQIWYEEDDKTATIIGSQKTPSLTFTYTDTTSECFMYDTQTGVWRTPQSSPFNL